MADFETSDSSEETEPEPGPTRENINPQSIEGLFLVALEKTTPAERAQFLDEKCGDNLEQRRRVEALLLAYEDAGSFLENSPLGSGDLQPVSLDFLTPSENPDLLGTLGEYEIQEVIGQGGMGIVFRALDPKLNRIVAVKVMSPLLAINPNARKRFLREAQAAAAVSHPHIVTIHAVDEDQLPYLVMEYVVGQSLQEKLDKVGSLPVTEILRIGNQIAEGLAAAHKQGLIHRDIKPANILLENGVERVKITDFGLARAVDDVTITKTGEVSGTPQYMSPEQATGIRIDQRSDLFSLGAVLYAMCTGRSPFRASNLAAVVRRVCDDGPRPIEEVNEDIPDWLIGIVERLLEKQPDDRIQTAAEVAELLGSYLATAQQPAYDPRVSRPSRHHSQKQEKLYSHQTHARWGDRLAVWAGGLILLVPLFLWGIGSATGWYFTGNVLEMVIVSLLFCGPVGFLLMVCGAQNMVQPGSTASKILDGLFLLGCFFAGPVGVLLYVANYMKKRDAHFKREDSHRVPEPRDEMIIDEQRRSNKRVLKGVGIGVGFLLLVWGLSYGLGVLRQSQISVSVWFFLSTVSCLIIAGVLLGSKMVRSNFFRETIKSPWKILGWIILCVPLLFLCMFMVFLFAPMFARASNDSVFIDYDPKNPIMQIEVIETGKKYKHISHPALIKLKKGRYQLKIAFFANNQLHTFERGIIKQNKTLRIDLSNEIRKKLRDEVFLENEEEERKKNRGGILLLGQAPGLRVGLFPVDPMQARPEDGGFGFADRFYVLEPMTFEVPAGFYDVKISSSNMGWVVDYSNPQYTYTRIEVKPGQIFTVEVSRDYKKLAENQPDWSKSSLFEFVWPVSFKTKSAKRFKLTGEHGKVVQQLLEAFADGKPDVAESDLLKTENSGTKPGLYKSLKQKFNNGKHPAWGTLIVPGKAENTYRLVEPQVMTAKTVR